MAKNQKQSTEKTLLDCLVTNKSNHLLRGSLCYNLAPASIYQPCLEQIAEVDEPKASDSCQSTAPATPERTRRVSVGTQTEIFSDLSPFDLDIALNSFSEVTQMEELGETSSKMTDGPRRSSRPRKTVTYVSIPIK
ncbi:MAG: uncharacterized protein KVP18_003142 [Porospora cf. gigantea A]|uniref:uncharacterized protein n=1 Tax=Porospora cf. gigantea A TaxID=2853593 RepID=UPI003559C75D|nr:MAG: hypothetical protein KVP18_003142 [Porospora cf. gigantea A]